MKTLRGLLEACIGYELFGAFVLPLANAKKVDEKVSGQWKMDNGQWKMRNEKWKIVNAFSTGAIAPSLWAAVSGQI
jgi:hypothetical protein